MAYDFDRVTDRRGTDAEKWNVKPTELPMWVADMDFMTAPEILAAMQKRLDHGIFGYNAIPDSWYEAYRGWWKKRHGLEMDKNALLFCTGVIPAISSIVRKLTTAGENVLIQTPVYNIFFNSIVNNGRNVLECPLIYENHAYRMDFDALEKGLADPQTTLMILCNPHNPVGKCWDKETLAKVGILCEKHHVTVVSDEIHCDLTPPSVGYTPFASVSEVCGRISITCIAPTKTFNLAGLQTSAIYVPDKVLKHKVWRAINTDEVAEPNSFAVPAAVAAFTKGEKWLEELRVYLAENRRLFSERVANALPEIAVIDAQATYLVWIDVSAVCADGRKLAAFIRQKTGLYVIGGEVYGKAGAGFLRVNIACPRSLLNDGIDRLIAGIKAFKEQ